MAKPTTKQELIDHCLRKLGAPVLEVNVSEEQLDDCIDDAIQYFQERHFDGVERMYLKYKITQDDLDRGRANAPSGTGMVASTGSSTSSSFTNTWYENSNYINVPDSVIGVEKVFKFDTSSISGGMFSIKYQLFLNDLYFINSVELLQYQMTKRYLEDIDFLLTTDKQIRFNKRQDRLYLDIDWGSQDKDQYLVLDCYRALDPSTFSGVYNDSFLKRYCTALIKKQWGQNLIKFKGVKLPGGIEFNGREIYQDGVEEVNSIRDQMSSTYELPPLDMIG